MLSVQVVPAIIPLDATDLTNFLGRLPGLHEIHVDVVDGDFVPLRSWPYEPIGTPADFYDVLDPYTLEVDLMVAKPLAAARDWLAAGADMLVFHVETISREAVAAFTESHQVTVGIAANNDTPDSVLWSYLPHVDYVQVMGIKTIGLQGQPFDDRALARIARIKHDFPQLAISLDGSVNESTLSHIVTTQIDRFIVGSAVYRAKNPLEALTHLRTLVSPSTGVAFPG